MRLPSSFRSPTSEGDDDPTDHTNVGVISLSRPMMLLLSIPERLKTTLYRGVLPLPVTPANSSDHQNHPAVHAMNTPGRAR